MLISIVAGVSLALGVIRVCSSIQILDISVPNQRKVGEDAHFLCNYTLDDDNLYSVKWYKDENEFYRYTPSKSPPIQVFPLLGIQVDIIGSNDRHLVLKNVSLETRGQYRCEVSAEYPSYQTVSRKASMSIYQLPFSGPVIKGGQTVYQLGDMVDMNCTSDMSRPAAHLDWFINEKKVEEGYVTSYTPKQHPNGLFSSASRLRFQADRKHFDNRHMKVKCVSAISTFYLQTYEKSSHGSYPMEARHEESSAPVQQRISNLTPPFHHPQNWWLSTVFLLWFVFLH